MRLCLERAPKQEGGIDTKAYQCSCGHLVSDPPPSRRKWAICNPHPDNGMIFDGVTKDPRQMAVRDALIAFMAATSTSTGG
jgi:hypothetical protein